MLHYIIVKWNDNVNKTEISKKVREMYASATDIQGVSSVEIKENVIPRSNRYDIMIILDIDKDSLSIWDESDLHKQWKTQFGTLIEKKCIFDS